ncbi:sensor domain-containing diguanylate cyclase [Xanthobacter versatilis]|uniref:sensor domain-containing diguanylate cyclase n=1 Tax=Xanthobacter autotrophicus (strain ATCC BAA-1158 / Py2) TaxID=78245 RepID=UPI0037276DC9
MHTRTPPVASLPDVTPANLRHTVALSLVLAAAYVVLGRLTFAVSVEYGNVTSVVFAPEGVALAFCILFGPRVALGIFLGQTILSLWSGPSLLGGAVIGLTNAAEGALGGWLFRRMAISPRFGRPRDVALFVALVFLILQPVSASGGVLVLYLLGAIPTDLIPADWAPWWIQGLQKPLPSLDLVPSAWVHWWIGNSVGQLLVAPLILAWSTPPTPGAPKGWLDIMLSAGGVVLVAALTLSGIPTHPLLLLAMTYFLLVWIGLRRGLRGITLANVLIGAAVTWAGASGAGFMSHLSVADRLSNVGFFVAAACTFSLMLFAMFEERRLLIDRLTRLASWDSLVELHNRRHFIERADREVAAAQRYGRDLVLLMLDADNFKELNDQYGHAAGDAALKMIAEACAAVARQTDVTGRIGGEEFAMLLPHATLDGGQALAERLRRQIEATPVQIATGRPFHVTVSIGIARLGRRDGLDALMRAADRALYAAKRAGRNRAALAD